MLHNIFLQIYFILSQSTLPVGVQKLFTDVRGIAIQFLEDVTECSVPQSIPNDLGTHPPSYSKYPDRPWYPPILLFKGYWGIFPWW